MSVSIAPVIAAVTASTTAARSGSATGGGPGQEPPWWVICLVFIFGLAIITTLICLLWACL